jgi:hypothetical protein
MAKTPRKRLTINDVQLMGEAKLLRDSEVFRRFIWTILGDASIFLPTHSPGSPYETSYREGRRALGLEILHRLKASTPNALALLEEAGLVMDEDRKMAGDSPIPDPLTSEPEDEDLPTEQP